MRYENKEFQHLFFISSLLGLHKITLNIVNYKYKRHSVKKRKKKKEFLNAKYNLNIEYYYYYYYKTTKIIFNLTRENTNNKTLTKVDQIDQVLASM